MRILLVEPKYYSRYPPLGLLKLASYYRSRGCQIKLVNGNQDVRDYDPDKIEITSLFTYAWNPVHSAIEYYHDQIPDASITVGGIYASIMPQRIMDAFPFINIKRGLFEEAERYLPSYDILETVEKWNKWNSSILFSSRGCIRKCPFCVVPKLEGNIRSVIENIDEYIYPGHRQIILWDNNFLASPRWREILNQLKDTGLKVDFNQGLDARLINEENASLLADLNMPMIRMAYDDLHERDSITRAVDLFEKCGVKGKNILFYTLFNFYDPVTGFGDTPESFWEIIREIAELGCASYPMSYEPLDSLVKNKYISQKWKPEQLEMVADARRVIGFGGAFPPYQGLVDKFCNATSFDEAFGLRPVQLKEGNGNGIGEETKSSSLICG